MDEVTYDALLMAANAGHMTVAGSFEAVTFQDKGNGFKFEPLEQEEFEEIISRLDEVSYIGDQTDRIADKLRAAVAENEGEYHQVEVFESEGYEATGVLLAAYPSNGKMCYWSVNCNE